jgi:GH24 family phage-related lysozyme (muramidase)
VRDIKVPWSAAEEVFNDRTLPQEIRTTLTAFPGSADKLPADAFGALVSLVFNRGGLIDDSDRRREMREIRQIISEMSLNESNAIHEIAAQFRSMKRLWPDHHNDSDLVARREAEAEMIEGSMSGNDTGGGIA